MKVQVPFALLTPVPYQEPRVITTQGDLNLLESMLTTQQVVALDIETKGTEAHNPENFVVGFGLATSQGSAYFPQDLWPFALRVAAEKKTKLIAHNLAFDGAFALRDGGEWLNWVMCTYATYKHLASEGFINQKWGLKSAQTQLLGWPETNEKDLDEWLISNGYVNQAKKPIKGEMWRAPSSILGHYCALDAASTLDLYHRVLFPVVNKFNGYQKYLPAVLNLIRCTIEQQLSGFLVDESRLVAYDKQLEHKLETLHQEFLLHEDVAPHVRLWNEMQLDEIRVKEPAKYKTSKVPKEPSKYRKDGSISKNWTNWKEKHENAKPEIAKSWENWKQRYDKAHSLQHFNINSGPQLQWLFYTRLGHEVKLHTDKGLPATDNKAKAFFGEPGKILLKYDKLFKERGYVSKALVTTKEGLLHPQFKVPGTLTGRLSGTGGLNLQQQPKTKGYLECFRARPGRVWVDHDFTALEPCVLTELSRDPNMLKIYGPGAKKNDIYIFTGAAIPGIGEVFKGEGYNADNPIKDAIDRIKKQHKTLRQICKVIVLSAQYGAGPGKIRETLSLQGIEKSFEEVQAIHKAYWNLYRGIKEYERFLVMQWERNGGWVLNGIGRPICVDNDLLKDIVNRVVQSTGHDILMLSLVLLREELESRRLNYSWVISDFHDETILEVDEAEKDATIEAIRVMYDRLNKLLGSYVPIKGEPEVGYNLAAFKVEE